MMAKRSKKEGGGEPAAPELRIKIRVAGAAIGPGKITLLEGIERSGSISAAARAMGMSFRRAWHLVGTLNAALGRAVVETEVGGPGGGGARLTEFGSELVARYRKTLAGIDAEAAPFLDWIDGEGPADE